jgi:hypothetical protein
MSGVPSAGTDKIGMEGYGRFHNRSHMQRKAVNLERPIRGLKAAITNVFSATWKGTVQDRRNHLVQSSLIKSNARSIQSELHDRECWVRTAGRREYRGACDLNVWNRVAP